MISERDIYASATNLIKQHGDDAAFVAAQRADELNENGDRDGYLIYLKILKAIAVLNDTQPTSKVRH